MTKNAIVSGGSRGLGEALVSRMISGGWNVLTFSRNMTDTKENYDDCELIKMKCDLRLDRDVELVVDRAATEFGNVDLLVLNAGTITVTENLITSSIIDLRRVFETNVFANFLLAKTFRERNPNGMVVHVTSDAAKSNYPGWGIYGASKAAMDYLIKTLAAENGGKGAFSLDPGDMDTEMHRMAEPKSDTSILQKPRDAADKFYLKLLGLFKGD